MPYDPHRHHRRSIRLKGWDYAGEAAYFVTLCVQGRAYVFGEIIEGEMRLNAWGRIVAEYWQTLPRHFPTVELGAFVVMPNHVHFILSIHPPMAATGAQPDIVGAQLDDVNDVGAQLDDINDVGAQLDDVNDVGAQLNCAPTHCAPTHCAPTHCAPTHCAPTHCAPTHGASTVGVEPPVYAAIGQPFRVDPQRPTLGQIVRAFKAATARLIHRAGGEGFAWQRNYYEHIIRDEGAFQRIAQYIWDNPANWAMDAENPMVRAPIA